MGDIDQNQFQTQQTHGVANEAVSKQVDAKTQLVNYITAKFKNVYDED